MMKSLKNPYLLLTLTALFWSGNMVVGRGIRADVPPLAMAFWRWLLAFLLILPLAAPHFRTQWPLLRRSWRSVTLLGLLGVGGYNTFAYLALQTTTATNAVLLNSFIPVATMAIGGAANAGLMAAAILAVSDPAIAAKLDAWRETLSASIPEEPKDE